MIRLGITGTRFGMTEEQDRVLFSIVNAYDVSELHHGDCIGVDEESHILIMPKVLDGKCKIIIHPPVDVSKRAFCKNAAEVLPPKTYFARDREIVHSCDILIAMPFMEFEESHSGTWYTVNYARMQRRWLCIVWPSGKITVENNPL